MISKRIKRLTKLAILIATRQFYFLGRNIYLLSYQPYETIKKIWDEGDKSQSFLLAVTALTPSIVYIIARITYDLWKYDRIILLTGNVFNLAVAIQGLVLGYLGYWFFMVVKNSK